MRVWVGGGGGGLCPYCISPPRSASSVCIPLPLLHQVTCKIGSCVKDIKLKASQRSAGDRLSMGSGRSCMCLARCKTLPARCHRERPDLPCPAAPPHARPLLRARCP